MGGHSNKPYSTDDVEKILRELAAQDKRTPMSDEFTAKMLRLIGHKPNLVAV